MTDPTPLQEQIEAALIRATEDGADRTEHYAAAVLPIIRAAQAEAWDEAYRCGVDDARLADDLRVDVGLGPDLYAQPARNNPYRSADTEKGN